MRVLAFDVGGTRLKAAVVGPDGRPDGVEAIDLPADATASDAFEAVTKAGRALADSAPDGVAVAVPGIVSEGVVVSLPGKLEGLEGTDVGAVVREIFGVDRVVVTNDAVACAVGEAAYGAGRGARRIVAVTIGTGVGVCVVEDGRPVGVGPHGGGILGGFIPIFSPDEGPLDSTGNRGTIEALCNARRIDEPGYRAFLARALVALAHAHAPEVIVLGGGPMNDAGPLLDGLEEDVNARLWPGYSVRLRPAALGDGAALAGVAHLLR